MDVSGDAQVATVAAAVYRPVWQTWNLVRPSEIASAGVQIPPQDRVVGRSGRPAAACDSSHENWRERIQIARVEQRLSIADLARGVGCDMETLASFERGDEVIGADVLRRVRDRLRL